MRRNTRCCASLRVWPKSRLSPQPSLALITPQKSFLVPIYYFSRPDPVSQTDKSVDAERGPAFLVLLPGCVPLTLGSGTSKGGQERRVRKDSSQNPTVK